MVVWCTANGCKNNQNTKTDGRKLSFHRFPRDGVYRQAWIKAINRANFVPTKFNYLCSAHFTEDQFDRTKASKYGRLRETAIPTLFKGHPKDLKKIPTAIAPKISLKNNVIKECTPLFNSNVVNISPINNVNGSSITVLVQPQTIGSNFTFLPVANNKCIPSASGGLHPDYANEFIKTVHVETCASGCGESNIKIVDVRTCTSDYEEAIDLTVDVGTCTSDYEESNELTVDAITCYKNYEKCNEKGVDVSTCTSDHEICNETTVDVGTYTSDHEICNETTVDVGTCTSEYGKSNEMTFDVGTSTSDYETSNEMSFNVGTCISGYEKSNKMTFTVKTCTNNYESNETSDNESVCDYNVETSLTIDEGTCFSSKEDESIEASLEKSHYVNNSIVDVETSAMTIYQNIKTADKEFVSNNKTRNVITADVGEFAENSEECFKIADVQTHSDIRSSLLPKVNLHLKEKNTSLKYAKKRKILPVAILGHKKLAINFT